MHEMTTRTDLSLISSDDTGDSFATMMARFTSNTESVLESGSRTATMTTGGSPHSLSLLASGHVGGAYCPRRASPLRQSVLSDRVNPRFGSTTPVSSPRSSTDVNAMRRRSPVSGHLPSSHRHSHHLATSTYPTYTERPASPAHSLNCLERHNSILNDIGYLDILKALDDPSPVPPADTSKSVVNYYEANNIDLGPEEEDRLDRTRLAISSAPSSPSSSTRTLSTSTCSLDTLGSSESAPTSPRSSLDSPEARKLSARLLAKERRMQRGHRRNSSLSNIQVEPIAVPRAKPGLNRHSQNETFFRSSSAIGYREEQRATRRRPYSASAADHVSAANASPVSPVMLRVMGSPKSDGFDTDATEEEYGEEDEDSYSSDDGCTTKLLRRLSIMHANPRVIVATPVSATPTINSDDTSGERQHDEMDAQKCLGLFQQLPKDLFRKVDSTPQKGIRTPRPTGIYFKPNPASAQCKADHEQGPIEEQRLSTSSLDTEGDGEGDETTLTRFSAEICSAQRAVYQAAGRAQLRRAATTRVSRNGQTDGSNQIQRRSLDRILTLRKEVSATHQTIGSDKSIQTSTSDHRGAGVTSVDMSMPSNRSSPRSSLYSQTFDEGTVEHVQMMHATRVVSVVVRPRPSVESSQESEKRTSLVQHRVDATMAEDDPARALARRWHNQSPVIPSGGLHRANSERTTTRSLQTTPEPQHRRKFSLDMLSDMLRQERGQAQARLEALQKEAATATEDKLDSLQRQIDALSKQLVSCDRMLERIKAGQSVNRASYTDDSSTLGAEEQAASSSCDTTLTPPGPGDKREMVHHASLIDTPASAPSSSAPEDIRSEVMRLLEDMQQSVTTESQNVASSSSHLTPHRRTSSLPDINRSISEHVSTSADRRLSKRSMTYSPLPPAPNSSSHSHRQGLARHFRSMGNLRAILFSGYSRRSSESSADLNDSHHAPYRPPSMVAKGELARVISNRVQQTSLVNSTLSLISAEDGSLLPASDSDQDEVPVFIGRLYKLGGNKHWQRREFRFDGTHLVCLRPKREKVAPRTVRYLQPRTFEEGFYNTDPPLPRVGHPLIATADPDNSGWTRYYQAPKWVIPVSQIEDVTLLTRRGVKVRECFAIITKQRQYVLRGRDRRELACWLFLLKRMVNAFRKTEAELEEVRKLAGLANKSNTSLNLQSGFATAPGSPHMDQRSEQRYAAITPTSIKSLPTHPTQCPPVPHVSSPPSLRSFREIDPTLAHRTNVKYWRQSIGDLLASDPTARRAVRNSRTSATI